MLLNSTALGGIDKMEPPARSFFLRFFGYDLLEKSLFMTPDQVKLFLWRKESGRRKLLLEFKSIHVSGSQKISAIYSFKEPLFRGFEMGNPAINDRVDVLCFDSADHQLRFDFASRPGSDQSRVTQEDINRVLQTLRPVIGNRNSAKPLN